MDQYPAISYIVKHGKVLAAIAGIAPLVFIAALLLFAGFHWLWSVTIIAAIPVSYLFARAAVELVIVISDMLLPK